MNVVISLPDSIVQSIGANQQELEKKMLESFALEGYRSEKLTAFQVGEILGFKTPMQVDEFLKANGEFIEYTDEEIAEQRRILDELFADRKK